MLNHLLPWIRFLRLPAVLTVPGDVWVGAAFVGREWSVSTTAAMGLAYLFGMALNDLADAPQDRLQRPERPVPAGDLQLSAAWGLCGLLAGLAWLLQPGLPILVLLLLIAAYDFLKNWHPWLGALLMAACRCAVLWIGAGAPSRLGPLFPLFPLFVLWGLLIFAITLLADREKRATRFLGGMAWVMTLYWIAAPIAALMLGQPRFLILLPWILLGGLGLQNLRQILEQGEMQPRNTGQWLAMLIPLQAAFLFTLAPVWQGLLVLALWPILRGSVRRMQIS